MSEKIQEKVALSEDTATVPVPAVPARVADTDSAADPDTDRGRWSTTRTELWAFYVYYIVSSSWPSRFDSAQTPVGKQWAFRLQLWAIAVPEPALPRGL